MDGLPPGEGVFLPCSFWLVQVMTHQGRLTEADALFERLLALRNDLGLLSEEYDPALGRLVGNFPQAFTHLALVDAALTLQEGLSLRAPTRGQRTPRRDRRRAARPQRDRALPAGPPGGARVRAGRPRLLLLAAHALARVATADGRIEQVALLYGEPDPPVLLALAEEPTSQAWTTLLRSLAPEAGFAAVRAPVARDWSNRLAPRHA